MQSRWAATYLGGEIPGWGRACGESGGRAAPGICLQVWQALLGADPAPLTQARPVRVAATSVRSLRWGGHAEGFPVLSWGGEHQARPFPSNLYASEPRVHVLSCSAGESRVPGNSQRGASRAAGTCAGGGMSCLASWRVQPLPLSHWDPLPHGAQTSVPAVCERLTDADISPSPRRLAPCCTLFTFFFISLQSRERSSIC